MRRAVARAGPLLSLLLTVVAAGMPAQTCTTQAKMSPEDRTNLSNAAQHLAQSIKASDLAQVQGDTIAEFASASAFGPTAALVQSVSARLAGDTLVVTQIYELDARSRKAGDTSDAEFSCALTGTTAETDFSISGLPPGFYGFAMVEASGDRPWLLAFLLRQDGDGWKLAGFYPRARVAAGHDGLWYWNAARADAKAKEHWLAWVFYGEADQLLRPANFASSTNLDRLRSEQRAGAPPELIGGIGTDTPLIVKASDGTEYRLTGIAAEASEDGKQLNLVLHLRADYLADAAAAKARNVAAARALFDAHKELRQGFNGVWIFADSADSAGHEPLLTIQTIADIP
jgi:hypothetical protein